MPEDFSRSLFKTLAVLKPYLPQVVIGGGWAPFLYFLSNIGTQFESADAEGSIRIVEQRPSDAFPGLGDDQLRYFAQGTMEQFIQKLKLFATH